MVFKARLLAITLQRLENAMLPLYDEYCLTHLILLPLGQRLWLEPGYPCLGETFKMSLIANSSSKI